eukprot:200257_1
METLRKDIKGWSLESDDKLLRALQLFSSKILEQTERVDNDLHSLYEETCATSVQLQNASNRFSLLSSNKFVFIETRTNDVNICQNVDKGKKTNPVVCDMEVAKQNDGQATDDYKQQQSNLQQDTSYKKALNCGMAAMLHTVSYSTLMSALKSQKDDIEAGVQPRLPKCDNDIYNNQPLPCLIGTPEFAKWDDLGLFGAFHDNIFYNIHSDADTDNDFISSDYEDYDFLWLRLHAEILLPKFEDFYEPHNTKFYRENLRNFFPDADDEQIDDMFEYFEDANGYDLNEPEWITGAQIIILLKISLKEQSYMDDEHKIQKNKGSDDQLAQFSSGSDDDDDDD